MSTTTTRRLPVTITDRAGTGYRRLRELTTTVLTSYRRDTGRVLAIHCPVCRHWVKPRHYQPTTGTCRRCGRNRHQHNNQ
jgi:uncharacterized CHY-type Zn-finger protein